MDDLISRQAAIDVMLAALDDDWESDYAKDRMCELPSAQLNPSEAYSKAVFTWLRDYQIRAAELKGRYTP